MIEFLSHSRAETEELGETWGRDAQSGLVIGLSGELGAGKTQLVKGVARGLGTPALVHSPTFALVNIYADGRLKLFHLDLYRLPADAEREHFVALGLDEYLNPAGVTIIEWVDRCFGPVGSPALRTPGIPTRFRFVRIEITGENERRITYEDSGA